MTVEELISALRDMPAGAVVLYEGDAGYALVGGLNLHANAAPLPDEVILFPDMSDD